MKTSPAISPAPLILLASAFALVALIWLLPATVPIPTANAAPAQANATVTISDFQFTPATVTVTVGSTITWTNAGPSLHTVTAASGAFGSAPLGPGGTFTQTFGTAGTFEYFCSFHAMTGQIKVTDAVTSPTPTSTAQPTTTPAPSAVTIQNNAFAPAVLTVTAGTVVTWTNRDPIGHAVTANDNSFNSGTILPGGVFTRSFSAAGTVPYYCAIHSSPTANFMNGVINVTGAAATPTPAATTTPTVARSVTITFPTSGSTAPGTSLTASFTATGVTIVAADGSNSDATGHFHLFVDRSPVITPGVPMERNVPGVFHTAQSSQIITGLVAGPHFLTLVLGHGDHTPFTPPVSTTVNFLTAPAAHSVFLPAVFRSFTTGW